MQAKITKIHEMIERPIQYIVPLFQRTYSWDEEEWEDLWEDIVELREKSDNHFFGVIVTRQIFSGPEDINQYELVDDQQRLTTIFIILASFLVEKIV